MQISPQQLIEANQFPAAMRGFLLTRSARDRNNHIEVCLWLKTPAGPVQLIVSNERAVFFVEQTAAQQAESTLKQQAIHLEEIKPVALKAFNQANVVALYFSTLLSKFIFFKKIFLIVNASLFPTITLFSNALISIT